MTDAGEKISAIIVAAGSGRRMGSDVPKQYLPIGGKPLLYYTLRAFEYSTVDEVILVTGADWQAYCRGELVQKYGFAKVTAIVCGGAERTDSVEAGLSACTGDYVLIHDGARPMVTVELIARVSDAVTRHDACVAGMPVKDTIKIVDETGQITATPDRRFLWQAQTPQAFSTGLLQRAYEKLHALPAEERARRSWTDDAALVYDMTGTAAFMAEGSYMNLKVTTPEDRKLAEEYLCRP